VYVHPAAPISARLYSIQAKTDDVEKRLENELFSAFSGECTESADMLLKTRGATRRQSPPNQLFAGYTEVFLGFCDRYTPVSQFPRERQYGQTQTYQGAQAPSRLPLVPPMRPAIGRKRVQGRLYYFGKVANDPKGQAALDLWLAQKDDLLAGYTPG